MLSPLFSPRGADESLALQMEREDQLSVIASVTSVNVDPHISKL